MIEIRNPRMKYLQFRNFGIFAHIDAGKTTLTERILFQEKVISSFGDIESGTTETDFLDDEISRGISIQSAVVQFEKTIYGRTIKLNLIDTPGHLDFDEQVDEALSVIDLAVLVVDVRSQIQTQTEYLWKRLFEKKIPVILFLNKLDSYLPDLRKIILNLNKKFRASFFPAYFLKKNDPQKIESILRAEKNEEEILIPFIEWSEELSARYLKFPNEIRSIALEGLKTGFHKRFFFPVLAGSAKTGIGVNDLIELVTFVETDLISPEVNESNSSAYIFKKQIHPQHGKIYYLKALCDIQKNSDMYYFDMKIQFDNLYFCKSLSLNETLFVSRGDLFVAKVSADLPKGSYLNNQPASQIEVSQEKKIIGNQFGIVLEPANSYAKKKLFCDLEDLVWEDSSYSFFENPATGQMELWGIGELHLEIGVSRLLKKNEEKFSVGRLKVARYELWKNVTEKHVFSHSILDGEQKSGELTVFLEKANDLKRSVFFEESVPDEIRNPVRDGFEEIMSHGNFGEEVLGVNLRVVSYKAPNDFDYPILSLLKVAVISGLKSNIEGRTELTCPLSSFEIIVPEFCLGKVLAELRKRKAKILNVEERIDQECCVEGEVSAENLLGFAASLRNMTKGKGIVHSRVTFSSLKYCVIE